MSENMISKPFVMRFPLYFRKMYSFPVPFWITSAGEIRKLPWKSAREPANWPVPMNLLRRCPMAMILILSRAVPMYPVVRNNVSVLPEPC